jgi:hypothetical protein
MHWFVTIPNLEVTSNIRLHLDAHWRGQRCGRPSGGLDMLLASQLRMWPGRPKPHTERLVRAPYVRPGP